MGNWPEFIRKHYGGTLADTAPLTVNLKRNGHGITIRNKEASGGHAMGISFDNGKNYYQIPAGTELNLEGIKFFYFIVVAEVATVAWCALVAEG